VEHEGVYDLTTDARDLADLAHGLVDSLRAVHAAGVIHRDLKPSNVMLGAQGPVLIDFGIAQVADDVRLTQTGQVTGTPGLIHPGLVDGGGGPAPPASSMKFYGANQGFYEIEMGFYDIEVRVYEIDERVYEMDGRVYEMAPSEERVLLLRHRRR